MLVTENSRTSPKNDDNFRKISNYKLTNIPETQLSQILYSDEELLAEIQNNLLLRQETTNSFINPTEQVSVERVTSRITTAFSSKLYLCFSR